MRRDRTMPILLATLLTLTSALAVAAQDEPFTPEGVDWVLTSYATLDADEPALVPLTVDATLRLESGIASGSGGCNTFSGTYVLDGTALTFSPELTSTLVLCEPEVQAVEDAYLAALPSVAGWSIIDDVLVLTDELGAVLLSFEVADVALTPSQFATLALGLQELLTRTAAQETTIETLQAQADELRSQVDGLNIDRLRQRLRTLERDNAQLREALEASRPNQQGQQGSGQFTAAERVLLEGIPPRIASHCTPLRSSLPKGTRAAVSCQPNTSAVSDVDYFLMAGQDAAAAFTSTMNTFNVPEATGTDQTCETGVKSQRHWLGSGWQSEGCFRTSGRSEVRFVDNATDCRQLRVGGARLASPAIYMALQADGPNIAAIHDWATRGLGSGSTQRTSITRPIQRPNAAPSPSCPT